MNKLILAGAVLALALTGCASATAEDAEEKGSTTTNTWGGGWIGATEVTLPDGRTVTCAYYGSSLSCDWEHTNEAGGN